MIMAPRHFDETCLPRTPHDSRVICRSLASRLGAFVEVLGGSSASTTGLGGGRLSATSFAVKDMVDISGRAAALGLVRALGPPAGRSADVIARLAEAGGEIVAVTEMTPLAFEPSGANPARGRPLNPWSATHICGGSSSGSAVAVASGCVPLALGSDTAGSLRIPAHCCGVTAWKPTQGLVPVAGTMPLAPTLDSIGFLARTARAIRPAAELFAGTAGWSPIRRLGIARDLFALSCPEANAALAALERIASAWHASHEAAELQQLLAVIDPVVLRLLQAEAARSTAGLLADGAVDAALAGRLVKGLAITDAQLEDDRAFLRALSAWECARVFADADAILLPVMPGLTPRVAQCDPSSPAFSGRALYELSRFTRFVNALGWPAVALPAGFDGDGLPIGLQLVGPPGSDLALLDFAARIQGASDWHGRVPTCLLEVWPNDL
jgi:Asp-tRNA(Asn)/Glu-tRNA(Gln) amidotransferase A subunit family amidase